VLRSLTLQELAVAAVYGRYGGSVNGEVIRLELMARGLLQVIEKRISDFYTSRQWQHDPIRSLADAILLHVPDEKQFQMIATSRRFRPFLLGCPRSHWLAVNRESRKELVTLLEELAFSVSRQLTHQGLPEIGGTAMTDPLVSKKK
jgi:hypothetical protein